MCTKARPCPVGLAGGLDRPGARPQRTPQPQKGALNRGAPRGQSSAE